ncbi:GNAT family N-acetyltransferase [Nocardiopsis flavescens]
MTAYPRSGSGPADRKQQGVLHPRLETPGTVLRVSRLLSPERMHELLGSEGLPSAEVLSQLVPAAPGRHSAQFTVRDAGDGTVVGVSGLHSMDLNGGHVRAEPHLAAGAGEDHAAAAGALTLNYAFAMFRVRKVYVWTVDPEPRALAHVPVRVQNEGCLREFVVDGGVLRDVTVLTVDREDWERAAGFLDALAEGRGAR